MSICINWSLVPLALTGWEKCPPWERLPPLCRATWYIEIAQWLRICPWRSSPWRELTSIGIAQVRNDMMEASKGGYLDAKASRQFNHLLLTLADVHGVLIKLADRLAALRKAHSEKSQIDKLAHEALEVFAPIANQLGVWSIKAALEDLAFKVVHSSSCNYGTHHLQLSNFSATNDFNLQASKQS